MLASRCTSCRRCRGEMVGEGGPGVAGVSAVASSTPCDVLEDLIHLGVAFGSTIWASVVVISREQVVHDLMRRRLRALRRRGRRAQGSPVFWAHPSGRHAWCVSSDSASTERAPPLFHAAPLGVVAQLRVCAVAAGAGYCAFVQKSVMTLWLRPPSHVAARVIVCWSRPAAGFASRICDMVVYCGGGAKESLKASIV